MADHPGLHAFPVHATCPTDPVADVTLSLGGVEEESCGMGYLALGSRVETRMRSSPERQCGEALSLRSATLSAHDRAALHPWR